MLRATALTVALLASTASSHAETCTASWYGTESGSRTANGERFTGRDMTAAHKTRPFGSYVTVTHLTTGRSVRVRINDRGPFVRGRCIDLSRAAAQALGMGGTAKVSVD
jgi:rare lipoprotein A